MLRLNGAFASRVARFALPVAASALAPLLCVVSISRVAGADAFLSLGLGQALGGMAAIAGTWGWDVNGPQRLRLRADVGRTTLLHASLVTRAIVLAFAGPGAAVLAYALAPEGAKALACLTAVAVSTQALSPSWWLAGTGRPESIMRFDALPRAAAAIVAVPVILYASQPLAYPFLTIAAVLVSYLTFYSSELAGGAATSLAPIRQLLRSNVTAAGIAVFAILYTTAALPLVQLVAPSAATQYAVGSRLLSYWNLSTITTTNALVGLIDDESTGASRLRRRKALLALTAQSLALGLLFGLSATWLSRFLFDIPLESRWVPVLAGLAFTLAGINTAVTKLVLIPEGRQSFVLKLVVLSAVVGTGVIPALAIAAGAAGAFAGVCVGEALITGPALAVMLHGPSRSSRRDDPDDPPPPGAQQWAPPPIG